MTLGSAGLVALALAQADGASAAEQFRPDYQPYGQGLFLSFLDAQGESRRIDRVPRLLVSFGDEPRPIVMDTGSTGIVVSAARIPNVDQLPSRPGKLTYSSSGRIMIGNWVSTPATLMGGNGASLATDPLPVLAVTRIACAERARDCVPEDHPDHVAMMGVGFGREYDGQSDSTPDKNPFLNLAPMGRDPARRGYIVTSAGVHIGLTRINTRGDFNFVKLDPHPDIAGEWKGAPVCMTVNEQLPAACGSSLVDTGVTAMFLTLPADRVGNAAVAGTLAPGTRLVFSFPGDPGRTVAARYDLVVGDHASPLAPTTVHLNTTRAPFVNTGVHLLNGFDVLYDADGGFIAYRARPSPSDME